MVEDLATDKEEEIVYFPKVDRGRLYSIILIFLIMISIYISIVINMFWIAVFVIVPVLSVSKREEVSQAKKDWKQISLESFSNLVKLASISATIVLTIFVFVEMGLFVTTILIFVSFSLFSYVNASIIRKNFEKSNKMRSEVS